MPLGGQPAYAVISGASRGFGRAVAVELAKSAGQGSLFVLLARSSSDNTAKEVRIIHEIIMNIHMT